MPSIFWIILLIVIGVILLLAELLLLPGITIAAIASFCCLVGASAWVFSEFGIGLGFLTLGIITLLVIIVLAIFLRPKTWSKMALNTEIKESISTPIDKLVPRDSTGLALTRLAPMGKVIIESQTYEAKTMGAYIDEGTQIKVIGYDNQNVIVEAATVSTAK